MMDMCIGYFVLGFMVGVVLMLLVAWGLERGSG